MQRDLALHLDNHYERNEARMERLFWALSDRRRPARVRGGGMADRPHLTEETR
jgi:hypothetical protein